MADLTKLQNNKKNRLGSPPGEESIRNNLDEPETIKPKRSREKTGRTYQLGTRVTEDFYYNLKVIAARDRIKMVEVLEKAVELYEHWKKTP